MTTDPGPWLRSVRRSHDRLAAQVQGLAASDLDRPSYCAGWTIAQVLSHLGSQAEIFSLFLEAGLQRSESPAQSAFAPIWEAWNARTPGDQAADSIAANEGLLRRLEGLSEEQLSSFRLALFGMDLDAAGLLRMRLSEHAVHAWDVAVALDPQAEVAADAVELLVDGLPEMAARLGKAASRPARVAITTSAPQRHFLLTTDGVRLEAGTDAAARASVELPAEVLLRLVYGRVDDAHPPREPVRAVGVSMDELRGVFPGS
jgi:uncharacterized protein (TIGR03083 family)